MADQIEQHRNFLQTQFKLLTWGIGILFIFATSAFAFLFGKSYDSIKDKIIQEVDQKVIEYRIVETFKNRLDEQLKIAVENPKLTDKIYKILSEKITQHVSTVASSQVVAKINMVITQRLSEEIEKVSTETFDQLIERAVKDVLDEINKEVKKIANLDVDDINALKGNQIKIADYLHKIVTNFPKGDDPYGQLSNMAHDIQYFKMSLNR